MLKYKIDIIAALKAAGYPMQKIQAEKLLPSSTCTKINKGITTISLPSLNKVCCMLRCQPGDLLEWSASDEEKILFFK